MCGIAGIINKTPRAFDYSTFCSLGIANDARGGDSCGIFIDGKYEYGTNKQKYFQNFFPENELINNTKSSSVALLHCRKASVGNISRETAQPVVLTDENGIVKFVVLHNGTIHNYKELAEKYIPEVDIKGMTDSQVMARIFYYAGYDVLNEYNGGAVFAIVDYRNGSPKTYLFKGASKETKYSKDIQEERPLCYCIDKAKRELVFSSIGIWLLSLRRNCDAYVMKHNVLLEFTGKALVPVAYYDREEAFQKKSYTTGGTSKYYNLYSSEYEDDCYQNDTYLSLDLLNNTYSFKGKKAHGKLFVTKYGRVDYTLTRHNYEIWFFDGIALKNNHCFRFLSTLKKESGLSDTEFHKKFINVIRYLSIDEIYCKDNMWYRAVSPTGSVLFTGSHKPIYGMTVSVYASGIRKSGHYDYNYGFIDPKVLKVDINFKAIKEECKSLMK